MKLFLSDEAFELLVQLKAKDKISWVLAKRNHNNITNTLLQDGFIKPKGRPHEAIIYLTKAGRNVVNHIIPVNVARQYNKLRKRHFTIVISSLIWMVLMFLALGFNRWYLFRYYPVTLIMGLGIMSMITYWFCPVDYQAFIIRDRVETRNTKDRLLGLFHKYHLKWNRNVDNYFVDIK